MAKHILVIDDDKLIALTLKKLLTKEGFRVSVVYSGMDALKLIQNNEFDLIMSDIKMPAMDGVVTVTKIREMRKQLKKKNIPEIFITAYAKEDVYQQALGLGAVGYIEKPFEIKTLLETLNKAFSS